MLYQFLCHLCVNYGLDSVRALERFPSYLGDMKPPAKILAARHDFCPGFLEEESPREKDSESHTRYTGCMQPLRHMYYSTVEEGHVSLQTM